MSYVKSVFSGLIIAWFSSNKAFSPYYCNFTYIRKHIKAIQSNPTLFIYNSKNKVLYTYIKYKVKQCKQNIVSIEDERNIMFLMN